MSRAFIECTTSQDDLFQIEFYLNEIAEMNLNVLRLLGISIAHYYCLLFMLYIMFCRYYSTHSVCIPRLFFTRRERSMQFSLSVTMFNFLAFIFVAFAYTLIVIKSKQKRALQSANSFIHRRKGDNRPSSELIFMLIVCNSN